MNRGKYERRENAPVKKRNLHSLALILALVLLIGGAIGGTLAWVIAEADPVVNTFVFGDIRIRLAETELDENGDPVMDDRGNPEKTSQGNIYKLLPGGEYLKDPVVTVLEDSEACWLFVKLEEIGGVTVLSGDGHTITYGFDDYLAYTVADGWTQLYEASHFGAAGYEIPGIYYRYVDGDTASAEISYEVLKDNKITVQPAVDRDRLNALDNNGQNTAAAEYPCLLVKAYAVQHHGFEPEVSQGAEAASAEQVNIAALKAWRAVEPQGGS